jgi:hypothetical protein
MHVSGAMTGWPGPRAPYGSPAPSHTPRRLSLEALCDMSAGVLICHSRAPVCLSALLLGVYLSFVEALQPHSAVRLGAFPSGAGSLILVFNASALEAPEWWKPIRSRHLAPNRGPARTSSVASTTLGSNWLPALASRSAMACSWVRALR